MTVSTLPGMWPGSHVSQRVIVLSTPGTCSASTLIDAEHTQRGVTSKLSKQPTIIDATDASPVYPHLPKSPPERWARREDLWVVKWEGKREKSRGKKSSSLTPPHTHGARHSNFVSIKRH